MGPPRRGARPAKPGGRSGRKGRKAPQAAPTCGADLYPAGGMNKPEEEKLICRNRHLSLWPRGWAAATAG